MVVEEEYPEKPLTNFHIYHKPIDTLIKLNVLKKSMTTDQFYSYCMNISDDYFSMNEDKCKRIITVYGKLILYYSN